MSKRDKGERWRLLPAATSSAKLRRMKMSDVTDEKGTTVPFDENLLTMLDAAAEAVSKVYPDGSDNPASSIRTVYVGVKNGLTVIDLQQRENAELLKQVNRLDELKELARQSIVRIKAEALMEARSVVQTSLEHITDAWGEADPVEAVGATHDYLLAQLDDLIEREGKEADNE